MQKESGKVCMLSIAWILVVMFLRLSATNRRRGLRRLRMLTGGPTRYCAINPNTSILRIWFDVCSSYMFGGGAYGCRCSSVYYCF
ncbi:hypothetical protein DPEC_G00272120 [Dallia pectoralis]|uniref:Uncharacterized protein n=1 Tax=Dallia pectoralis TaxID=75939 RepID=A0ACC2FQ48_DALPE|nr:hypothetical protein DPEC_G00272120 [Dallia pectoralis]